MQLWREKRKISLRHFRFCQICVATGGRVPRGKKIVDAVFPRGYEGAPVSKMDEEVLDQTCDHSENLTPSRFPAGIQNKLTCSYDLEMVKVQNMLLFWAFNQKEMRKV